MVQTDVRNPLTDEILFGQLERGGNVRIRLNEDADTLTFTYEPAEPPEPAIENEGTAAASDTIEEPASE